MFQSAPSIFVDIHVPLTVPARDASTAPPQSLHVMSCITTFLREMTTSSKSATCPANACRSGRLVPWQALHLAGQRCSPGRLVISLRVAPGCPMIPPGGRHSACRA